MCETATIRLCTFCPQPIASPGQFKIAFEMINGEDELTPMPPLVIVKPDMIELVVSPEENDTAPEPDDGVMIVLEIPPTLISQIGLPLKLIDSL